MFPKMPTRDMFFAIFFPPYFLLVVAPRWLFMKAIPTIYRYIKNICVKTVQWFLSPFKMCFNAIARQLQILKERLKAAKRRLDEKRNAKKKVSEFMLIKDMKAKWQRNKMKIVQARKNAIKRVIKTQKEAYASFKGHLVKTKQVVITKPIDAVVDRIAAYYRQVASYMRKKFQFVSAFQKACSHKLELLGAFIKRKVMRGVGRMGNLLRIVLKPILSPLSYFWHKVKQVSKRQRSKLAKVIIPILKYVSKPLQHIRKGYLFVQAGKKHLLQKEYEFRIKFGKQLMVFPKKAAAGILRFCEHVARIYRITIKPPLDLFDYVVDRVIKKMKRSYAKFNAWFSKSISKAYIRVKMVIERIFRPVKRFFKLLAVGVGHGIYWTRLMIAWTVVLYEYGMELVQARAERVISKAAEPADATSM